MKNAVEVIENVEKTAKERAKPDAVKYGALAVGDYHRQGDVYIECLKAVPWDAVPMSKPSAQLAPGDTQGSRHILASVNGVVMYAKHNPTPLDGPIVEAKKPIQITHPEHGHVHLQPGVYGVTYQRQYAEEMRRVAD